MMVDKIWIRQTLVTALFNYFKSPPSPGFDVTGEVEDLG